MSAHPVKAGIVGCGSISGIYLKNAKRFSAFDITAVADMRPEAAAARAEEYGVAKSCGVEELLADPEVEIVINLTPHSAHGSIGIQAVEAGKSVYNEKPFAVDRDEGQKLVDLAKEKGVLTGAAPDTFFGGAWQTARKLIDEGAIGKPVGAMVNLHAFKAPPPQPTEAAGQYVSFYRTHFFTWGVTWAFDRGPYYLHALIHLLGPVRRVTASTSTPWPQVDVKTHFAGVLDFHNGAIGTVLITSDVHATGLPHIEVYGTGGSLRCIDPNMFGGPILLRKADGKELVEVKCEFGYSDNSRGIGIADMASAIRSGRAHRASGEMGQHVVDIVNALHEASDQGRHIELTTTCAQPAPLPMGLKDGEVD